SHTAYLQIQRPPDPAGPARRELRHRGQYRAPLRDPSGGVRHGVRFQKFHAGRRAKTIPAPEGTVHPLLDPDKRREIVGGNPDSTSIKIEQSSTGIPFYP